MCIERRTARNVRTGRGALRRLSPMKSNALREVWERYVGSWRVASIAEMREIYASCLAPDCVYTDPLTKAKGWDELAAYMTAFHDQIPGGHFVTQQFFAHHQRSVARWTMAGRDGEP